MQLDELQLLKKSRPEFKVREFWECSRERSNYETKSMQVANIISADHTTANTTQCSSHHVHTVQSPVPSTWESRTFSRNHTIPTHRTSQTNATFIPSPVKDHALEFAVSHQYARGPHANQGMQHASKYLETPVEFYPEDPPRNKEKVHVPGSSSTKALNSGSVTPSRPPKSPSPEEPKFISFQVSTSNGSPQVRSTSSSSQVSESPSFSDKKHQFLFDYSIAEKSSKHKNNKEYQCPINNCPCGYTRFSDLRSHFAFAHATSLHLFPQFKSKGRYFCEFCSVNFTRKKVLTRHVKKVHRDLIDVVDRRGRKRKNTSETEDGEEREGEERPPKFLKISSDQCSTDDETSYDFISADKIPSKFSVQFLIS